MGQKQIGLDGTTALFCCCCCVPSDDTRIASEKAPFCSRVQVWRVNDPAPGGHTRSAGEARMPRGYTRSVYKAPAPLTATRVACEGPERPPAAPFVSHVYGNIQIFDMRILCPKCNVWRIPSVSHSTMNILCKTFIVLGEFNRHRLHI